MKQRNKLKWTGCGIGIVLGVLLLLVVFAIPPVSAAPDVEIVNNGSRLVLSADAGAAATYQWERAETQNGTYTPIDGATAAYYDITAADENTYIRVRVSGAVLDPVGPIGKLVVMDIGKETIRLGATYSGKDSNGATVSGTHEASNLYLIVHKENTSKTTNNIVFSGNMSGKPFDVTLSNVNMGQGPSTANQAPGSGGACPSGGQITIPADSGNVKNVTLRLDGENQVRNITYYNGSDTITPSNTTSSLKITSRNGDGETSGALYVPMKLEADEIDEFIKKKTNYNHWNAGIGGTDSRSLVQNLMIAGGTIQVVTSLGDNCTAIGAGGNGYGDVTISGGHVVAHCNGTGAAIGGGIGWNAQGGNCKVTITGGYVYAKNHGNITSGTETVGGVAIGCGSSFLAQGTSGSVTITGGTVEAYGTFGNGIGGGNSSTSTGGSATINIGGGTVTATSIGGGNSKKGTGGSATVNISGSANVMLLKGIGGGLSQSGTGGAATITVDGNDNCFMNCAETIGGGRGAGDGNGGAAKITVINGTLTAESIGGGTGGTGGNGGAAEIYISGGTIKTGSIGGGGTENPAGNLGYAKAEISGGDITGQFIMAAAGTTPCTFTMTGGVLHGVDTADNTEYTYKNLDGGAVYMNDPIGQVKISGGTIENCAAQNGGAIYMSAGDCIISGEAELRNCTATENGGVIYMGGGTMELAGGTISGNGIYSAKNGGAVYMAAGDCTISGEACIDNCKVTENGGAIYLNAGMLTVNDGLITANTAGISGGGAFVNGGKVLVTDGSIFGNTANLNGGGVAVSDGDYHMVGGNVDGNTATTGSGGGIYVSAETSAVAVKVQSGSISNNTTGVDGGALAVVGDELGSWAINVLVGVDMNHNFDASGNPNCDHDVDGVVDREVKSCPQISGNYAAASGGAIFVTGSTNTVLNIYCLEEEKDNLNSAGGDAGQSNFMKMEGGKVNITTSDDMTPTTPETQDAHHGNTSIISSIYVTGGQMDLWGEMTNPSIKDVITVDIKKTDDHFEDHRLNNSKEKFYKLRYYENFRDPVTLEITGQYKEYEIPHSDTIPVVIKGNIYSHPGYTIVKWNTKDYYTQGLDDFSPGEDPGGDPVKGWYEVGGEYIFNGNPRGDMTIFAIWEPNGYTVYFEPNVPANEIYIGNMNPKILTYDRWERLGLNQFQRPGYDFMGWSRTPEGPVQYEDNALVQNLTNKKGDVVTLYAQWAVCDHNMDDHVYSYTVENDGRTLRRTCSCLLLSQTITLTAEDTVYDRKEHPADVARSSEWNLSVSYSKGGEAVVGVPVNAGTYTASVTENGYTASVTYVIDRAEQPAPSQKPYYDSETENDGSILSVFPVISSPLGTVGSSMYDPTYDAKAQYRVVYYVNDVPQATDWAYSADPLIEEKYAILFNLDKALTNYYIYARYDGCENYKPSDEVPADSAYFFVGNVRVNVVHGEGVLHDVKEAVAGTLDNGLSLNIQTKDGYFFPEGYTVTIETETEVGESPAILTEIQDCKEYRIEEIPDDCTITITLPDAVRSLQMTSSITEKQIFGSFSGNTAIISRDSAYTVRYDLRNYNQTAYAPLTLQFSAALPEDATVILLDKTHHVYYRADAERKTELLLTDFIRMGTEGEKFAPWNGDMQLQFVVDFARTDGGAAGEQITTTLSAVSAPGSKAETVLSGALAQLKNVTTYRLEEEATAVGGFVYEQSHSLGIASKWDNRQNALIIRPAAQSFLPEDAYLILQDGNYNVQLYPNADGNFIYMMPAATELGTIRVEVGSELQESEELVTYRFDVTWKVAKSEAESCPMNGETVESCQVSAVCDNRPPVSLRVTTQKQYKLSQTTHVSAEVAWCDLPLNYQLEAVLMIKADNGHYSSTGVTQTIKVRNTEDAIEIRIPVAGNGAGSYCLQITAEEGLIIKAEANSYFVME